LTGEKKGKINLSAKCKMRNAKKMNLEKIMLEMKMERMKYRIEYVK